jgi:CheY-like chemotaxis protein
LSDNPKQKEAVKGSVLIVEDNMANVPHVRDYLAFKGFDVHVAVGGLEGVQMAEKLLPDVVLMDIQMPGVSGLDAIKLIREGTAAPDVPIIALTALAMDSDRERCLATGASHYLSKPYSVRALLELIESIIQR